MVNIVPGVYERVKTTKNKKKIIKPSPLQTPGTSQRSIVNNILIASVIIEVRQDENKKKCLFFSDGVKCFDRLQLKNCRIEMKAVEYKTEI